MIFSSVHINDSRERHYPSAIKMAVDYLKNNDFMTMATGEYEIQGREIYAQVFDMTTGEVAERRPEVHEKFVDVQFLVKGKERLGFAVDTGNYKVAEHLVERDLIFYEDIDHEGFIEAIPGCYSIFYPSDIHRPGVISGQAMEVRKVVVKVAMSLL